MDRATYLVATVKPWGIKVYREIIVKYPGRWHLVTDPRRLTAVYVKQLKPRYIFFTHWSRFVPKDILDLSECVLFHATNLPYGRGGSPLQNLILRGHKETVVSAVRMVEQVDAGPIYLKRSLDLAGSAQEIFERIVFVAAQMIREIVTKAPVPRPQRGRVVMFKRRRPEESEMRDLGSLGKIHDFIRMLDAETYPRAFLKLGQLRLEFSEAKKKRGRLVCQVQISRR